ncbi:MAG: hypothetical protein K2M81_08745, partial [Lachnospiraceae bacterium]|nr:hypothetical protein [Lachnospiraceae bacterium]
GISGRPRLFEVIERVRQVNYSRGKRSKSISLKALHADNSLSVDYIVAPPRMALYIEYSARIYQVYLRYVAPEDIISVLQADLGNEEHLKKLLCSICAHLGIDGGFIKLVVENAVMSDRAGEISTDLAFTTIRLELKPRYTLDAVIAVLAHEATHLHLYYEGISMCDTWENEILTDTTAVYCGFGEYIYKGYALMQGEFALSYQKVGYISQEDVKYIETLMQSG